MPVAGRVLALALVVGPAVARAQFPPPRCHDLESPRFSDDDCADEAAFRWRRYWAYEIWYRSYEQQWRRKHEAYRPHLTGGFALGPAYRALFGTNFASGMIDLRFGADVRRTIELTTSVVVEAGAPVVRLPISTLLFGFGIRGILGERVRFGVVLRIGPTFFRRITTGELTDGVLFRIALNGTVDLVRRRSSTVFLGLEVGLDANFFAYPDTSGDASGSANVSALLGVRFRR
jgi:hypothetical protein